MTAETWTIRRLPAGARAAAIRCAEARAETVGEWVSRAIERQAATESQAPPGGALVPCPGLLVRHVTGGPTMVLTGPEALFEPGQSRGRWQAQWFHKGVEQNGCFWPVALELAPAGA